MTHDRAAIDGDELRAPAPGWFHRRGRSRSLIAPGDVIGELDVLGRITPRRRTRRCAALVELADRRSCAARSATATCCSRVDAGIAAIAGAAVADARAAQAAERPRVSRADERPLLRPAVARQAAVRRRRRRSSPPGATVCLLEVMKTFHRVTYGGAPVRVRELLVADGADVNAGDPLLALEAI